LAERDIEENILDPNIDVYDAILVGHMKDMLAYLVGALEGRPEGCWLG